MDDRYTLKDGKLYLKEEQQTKTIEVKWTKFDHTPQLTPRFI